MSHSKRSAVVITLLLYAVGYYLSYQLASALDRTSLTPSKRKAILIALPFAYFALAILLGGTVGLDAGTAR
jgi:NhaP-type Na+/H+ or K+/H+ antiporter